MTLSDAKIVVVVMVVGILGATATCAENHTPVRIVALGDSTTARMGKREVYARQLPKALLKRGIRAEVINAGLSADTTAGARERFERDVLKHNPDLVIIQYGINDSAIDVHKGRTKPRVSQADFRENLAYLLTALEARGSAVILMTPNAMLWRDHITDVFGKPPYDVNDRWGFNLLNVKYAQTVREVARQHGVPLVDVYQMFLDYDRVEGQSTDDLVPDGSHPNDLGHQLITEQLVEEIVALAAAGKLLAPLAPGYSIPLIDLADQKERQVVIDREAGQYLGHPTTVLLEDKRTMIVVYPKGHGRGAIVMKRSTDAGLTWSERLPVPDNWATSREVPTIHRVVNKQGVKRLIMFSGLYPIRMAVSEDDGATWTPLKPIGDYGGIVAMGCVARLKNGDYVAMFHDDGRFYKKEGNRTDTFTLYQVFSKDGGLTWGTPQAIWRGSEVHLCEPGIIRSPNDNELAILLRENRRRRNSHVMFSNDEARTWTPPRELPAALTGDRHTVVYAPDGRLFISFRDTTRESPTQGDWVAWVGTYDDICHGREGQYRVRLMDNHHRWDCAYPGVVILPDGTIVTTTYGHWVAGEPPFIVSVRLKLEELDKLASK
ncbi:MAG: GDSL-type esterase/lipase family protein [Planctomycetota bacterium]